jgi:hypothetical protein
MHKHQTSEAVPQNERPNNATVTKEARLRGVITVIAPRNYSAR